jgi:acetyl esterase/lipase
MSALLAYIYISASSPALPAASIDSGLSVCQCHAPQYCCTIAQYGEQDSVPSLNCCCAQDAEAFAKKCNDSGGNFELFVYDDAGHAFLTAEDHRESKQCCP